MQGIFEWDEAKNHLNQYKHGVSFKLAAEVFKDKNRVIIEDVTHSTPGEKRYLCFGIVEERVMTVRFTMRGRTVRIFGAAYWRKGKKIYEEENNVREKSVRQY